MKIQTPLALVIILLLSPTPTIAGPASTPVDEARVAKARAAVKELGQGLKEKLKAALKSGGPMLALPVCKTVAPEIAQTQSARGPMTIRRTALKLRNPKNAPDEFERRVLQMFTEKIEAGEPAATLEHSEIVTAGTTQTFRYMKAIPTAQKPCLACHGSNLKPDVQASINELYPDDQATGFKAGELRGAFSVSQPIK